MCGEMAGDTTAIPLLLGLGLDEFSMSAGAILQARQLVGELDQAEWAAYAEQALRIRSYEQVTDFVKQKRK